MSLVSSREHLCQRCWMFDLTSTSTVLLTCRRYDYRVSFANEVDLSRVQIVRRSLWLFEPRNVTLKKKVHFCLTFTFSFISFALPHTHDGLCDMLEIDTPGKENGFFFFFQRKQLLLFYPLKAGVFQKSILKLQFQPRFDKISNTFFPNFLRRCSPQHFNAPLASFHSHYLKHTNRGNTVTTPCTVRGGSSRKGKGKKREKGKGMVSFCRNGRK